MAARQLQEFTKTLQELGNQLPIGVLSPDGKLSKELELGDWTMREEEKISEAREGRGVVQGRFTSQVLAALITKIGHHDFPGMRKWEDRLNAISGMFVADVLYTYIFIRQKFYGEKLKLQFICPNCRKQQFNIVDLSEIDVLAVLADSIADLREEVIFSRPVQMESGELRGVIVEPTRWSGIESLSPGSVSNRAKLLRSMFKVSCGGLIWADPEKKIPSMITDGMIDKLSKLDLESLSGVLDRVNRGPVLRAEVSCYEVGCQVATEVPIDWSYDGFFTN